jgi:transcriptional regulator with XRE-family HTH domain
LVISLRAKSDRDAFVAAHLRNGLAFQIRALREARGWTQKELGDRVGMAQTTISQLENPDYGRFTTSTLLRLAAAFDVAYIGRFVPFSELVRWVNNLSSEDLEVPPFDADAGLRADFALSLETPTTGQTILANPSALAKFLDVHFMMGEYQRRLQYRAWSPQSLIAQAPLSVEGSSTSATSVLRVI